MLLTDTRADDLQCAGGCRDVRGAAAVNMRGACYLLRFRASRSCSYRLGQGIPSQMVGK